MRTKVERTWTGKRLLVGDLSPRGARSFALLMDVSGCC